MTEAEARAITALTDIADVAATMTTVWISFTFAYLTVAYFLGRS